MVGESRIKKYFVVPLIGATLSFGARRLVKKPAWGYTGLTPRRRGQAAPNRRREFLANRIKEHAGSERAQDELNREWDPVGIGTRLRKPPPKAGAQKQVGSWSIRGRRRPFGAVRSRHGIGPAPRTAGFVGPVRDARGDRSHRRPP